MGRSKFPGKPSKLVNKKRVSVLQGSENSGLQEYSEENSDYLLSDQVSFWNSRNETTTFGHDGAVQTTSVPQQREKPPSSEPPDGGGSGRRFQSVVKIDKPFNSGISTRSSHSSLSLCSSSTNTIEATANNSSSKSKSDPDKPKKKTVTFKTILETSDDASAVKKVYNPDNNAPLVPIIKKECLSRLVRLARSDCIVRPSRLTEILKNNSNNIDKLNALSFKITTSTTTSTTATITSQTTSSASSNGNEMDTTNVPCLTALSTLTSSSTSLNNEPDSNESKKSSEKASHHDALVVGDKRFILPKRSAHSCRVIKPNKRFLDDMDTTVKNIKKTNISGGGSKKATGKQPQDEEPANSGDLKCQKQNRSVDPTHHQESSSALAAQVGSGNNKSLGSDTTGTSDLHPNETDTSHPVRATDDTQSDSTEEEDDSTTKATNLFTLSTTKPFGSLFSSSKSILRQPRLQFDFQAAAPSFNASTCTSSSPFALNHKKVMGISTPNLGNSNICGVCGSIYSNGTQKSPTFDVFSCEACRKFITKTIKRIVNSSNSDAQMSPLNCSKGDGRCTISPVIGNKNKNIKRTFKERCHACWLQKCLKTFNISSGVRKLLIAKLPASLPENESCISPFSSSSSVGSSKENLSSTAAPENKSGGGSASGANNLFSSPCSNLLNWTESIENNVTAAQLPSNALVENNATFGSSPLLRPTVLEKRVFATNSNTNTPSSNESDRKNELDGTKSVINSNNDLKTTSTTSPSEEDVNKSKHKRTPTLPPAPAVANEVTKRQRIDLKGPRVKHVCRSASIVLGQPIATFGNEDEEPAPADETIEEEPVAASPEPISPIEDEPELPQIVINSLPSEELPSNCTSCSKSEESEVALSPPATPSEEETMESTELTMKKPAIESQKPLTRKISRTIANKRTLHRDGSKNCPVTISTDFWENYDPAEVSQTGFGLILTESISVRALCFLCGSAGQDPLIFCACCCEPYHQYCVEDEYNLKHSSLDDTVTSLFDASLVMGTNMNAITGRLNWLCPRCTVCYTCNMSSGSKVKCLKCQKNYHTTCLGTSKRLLGADRPLICANCLKCKSCSTTKVTKFVGNLPLCSQCFKLRKKGNFCPICQKCYEDNDFDLKMMECGDCQRWVHAKCEGLSDEQYNMLSTLPEHIEFICKKCSKINTQSNVWREAVAAEFKSGLLSVVKLLSKSRQACALLKISPRKKTTNCTCHPIHASRNIQFGSSSNDYRSFDEESHNSDDGGLEDVYEFKDTPEVPEVSLKKCFCGASDKQTSNTPTLIDIKRKINACEYVSVAEFNYDMINVISVANCDELVLTYKEIVSETFPWFQNETKACTDLLEEDMFDSCNFAQNSEIECDQQVPVIDLPVDIEDYFYSPIVEKDYRGCMMCKGVGEGQSTEESRLVYCGNNLWVHVNCALWSAEVFEEIDGSLQNVHSAISRGRLIKCTYCGNRGATVGCNVKCCGEHFHYPCARKTNCSFLTDKTVYCPQHGGEMAKKKYVEIETNFNIQRPVYVELDRKKKRMVEPSKVQFIIGSLVVKKLGGILPKFSDTWEALVPIDFHCTRLYWSIKEPWKIVEYTVKTSIQSGVLAFSTDCGRNFTVDHSNNGNIVQLGLAQIARWHNSLTISEENDALARQERSVKQLLEAVSQSFNGDDATEEEPQNNADLLPPEIKDAIFEDLPHELLDGISMLDIFPKLMIYEDMMNLDSKTEAFLSNECTKDGAMSEEDGNENSQKDSIVGAEIGSNWPLNLGNVGFNHIEDAMLSASRPVTSNREIKRSKSEVFHRSIGNNRSQQRSSSLTFSCKIDGSSAAKRRKLSKGFQDIRIPESVLLSIGRRKEDIPLLERHRTLQNDDIKTKTFNWSAAKKYSSSTAESQQNNSKARDSVENVKIPQLDGMDDLLADDDLSEFHQMQSIYEQSLADCPVKCDRCNCTYRTQESYQRHLPNCEPLSTSESESESARSPPIHSQHMMLSAEQLASLNGAMHPQSVSIVQNINQSTLNAARAISSPLSCNTATIPISCSTSTQSIQIQSLQNNSVPMTHLNQGMSNIILTNTQHQPQQQTQHYFPFNGAAQMMHNKNELPTVPVSSVSIPTMQTVHSQQQIFTMPSANGGTQQIVTIAPQQATIIGQQHLANPTISTMTQQKVYRVQNEKSSPKSKLMQSTSASKLRPKLMSNNTSKPIQMKKVIQRTDNRPISIMNDAMHAPGLILQQNTNTQPIIVQQVNNGPHNIMSYVTDSHGQPVQYFSVPSATDFKPQTHNAFMAPTNQLMQGTFLQTDSSGNLLLTNASTGLQMLSAGSLQLAQQAQPQVIGTLIQPQSGAMQCGVMSTEQMMLGAAPTLEMVTNPTMLLASQPVYYGLETIVQNTVMSSQQFVSTAMQGVLSQNASFSATTTQVFQASKIEPIMEVPSGYVVLNNVDGTTIMQQQTGQPNIISANVLQQPTLTQLQAQSQPLHAQVQQQQQINTQPIINIQQHHTQPQQTAQCIIPQQMQAPKLNTISPAKPTAKSTPIVVTKIQPQIINKVVPNLAIANNQTQVLQEQNMSNLLSNGNNIATLSSHLSSDGSFLASQPTPMNKMQKMGKAAPVGMSQQYPLKPKVSPGATNAAQMNIQPVRKLNMIRPLNKSSSVTIKPKLLSKPVNHKSNASMKGSGQTPTLIAPKPNFSVQRSTNPTIKVTSNDKSIPIQYNITLVDTNLSEQNQVSQQMSMSSDKGVVSASFQPSMSEANVVSNNGGYAQPSANLHYNSNCPVNQASQPVALHTSSIQLPSAPFNSPYANNIPTNIVNPIQQTVTSQMNNTVSRPTNRVLPMQTIQPKLNSPPMPEQKISEIKSAVKEDLIEEKDLKNSISDCPVVKIDISIKQNDDENLEDAELQMQVDFAELQDSMPKLDEASEKDREETAIDEDFDMKTSCDDITDNDDRSESTIPEVKEKISKILENLDDECNNLGFNHKEASLDQKYLVEQKENLDPQDTANIMCKVDMPALRAELQPPPKPTGPHVLFEIQSEDGFTFKSTSISEIWEKVFEAVQIARKGHGLSPLPEGPLADMCGLQMLGLNTNALRYLVEQLPGAERCNKYAPRYHKREHSASLEYASDQEELKENAHGSARCEPFSKRSDYDIFSWLASRHRKQPVHVVVQPSENDLVPRRGTGSNLPMAMKYRTLKETYKDYVGVFRSHIHGRGLYCTKDIEAGEMVIEYAGELIRSTLTDKRERYYDSKNIGCYMFKIDDNLVVDATMRGNAARFINHSCEPNCFSKVVDILGHKHIIIFALRRIVQGEELTYDYKFPFEEDKIPCSCRSRKCRKYLN